MALLQARQLIALASPLMVKPVSTLLGTGSGDLRGQENKKSWHFAHFPDNRHVCAFGRPVI